MRTYKNRVKQIFYPIAKRVFSRVELAGIVIGAQKGGTTALFKYLSLHPSVVPALVKEPSFFGCDSRYSKGLSYYHSLLPLKTPVRYGKVTFDMSSNYLVSADKSARRIYAYRQDMKLIVLLRNPITRAYSAWQMYRKFGLSNPDFFFKWVQKCDSKLTQGFFVPRPRVFGESFEDDILDEIKVMQSGGMIEMPILNHGLYYQQLSTYYNYFPREQILVLSSEEMKEDTIRELKKIEAFVGLRPHSWTQDDVKPHFVGGYNQPISPTVRNILRSFYCEPNATLYSMLDRDFLWE